MINYSQIINDFGVELADTKLSFHNIHFFGKTLISAIENARTTLSKSGGVVYFPIDNEGGRPSMLWVFQEGANNKITDNVYFSSRHLEHSVRPYLDEPFKEGDIIRNTNPDFDYYSAVYHKEKWYKKDFLEMHPRQIPFVDELPEANEERLGQLFISNQATYGTCIFVCVNDKGVYKWNYYIPNIARASSENYGVVLLDNSVSLINGRLSSVPPVGATYTQYIDEEQLIFLTVQEPENLYPDTKWRDISDIVVHVNQREVIRVWRRLS